MTTNDDSKPILYGPDGRRTNTMHGLDQLPPGTEIPSWLPGIPPGSRTVLAGWWWRIEQAVTNAEGQWALILTPIEPTAAQKKAEREARKVVPIRRRKGKP